MSPDRKAALVLALAAALAIPAEGLRHYAYRDPAGILTVCYGSTTAVESGRHYGLEECRDRLDREMTAALDVVERCQPGLPVEVKAAFGDAVYNLGSAVACNSTASRMLAAGDIAGACDQLPRWNKARIAGVPVELPGLTKRRAAEQALCRQGIGGGNG
ncbi:MAG: lysozyme [Rhodospirillaceae bacterium]|nr:lysozyme [Rhodospirillaceae bacterium]